MTPEGSRHAAVTAAVARRLQEVFGPGFHVRVQHPLAADEHSEEHAATGPVVGCGVLESVGPISRRSPARSRCPHRRVAGLKQGYRPDPCGNTR